MTDSRVLVSVVDHVAHVRLNRPDKRNGLDLAMFEGIIVAGQRLGADTSVRAVVFSGEGPAFCAGLDVKAFFSMGDAGERLLARPDGSVANLAQRVAWIWRELPMPVIAAIHGPCFGGGMQMALGADIRLVRADAQLSIMEIKWGLVPDMSLSKTVLDVVRLDVAKELMFTGRVVDGREAVELGLATRLSEDPVADALALAATIASKNPHAIRAGKKLLDSAPALSTEEAFLLETELQLAILGSANNMEAVQANMMKRAPVFDDPE